MSREATAVAPLHAAGVIVAHLGNGPRCAPSGTAVRRKLDGFHGTGRLADGDTLRSAGSGVVLYLMQEKKMSAEAITDLLYRESGLKGLLGHLARHAGAGGVRSAGGTAGDRIFCLPYPRELGGLAAVLQGLDAMVFCGGIGEHACTCASGCWKAWNGSASNLTAPPTGERTGDLNRALARARVLIPTDEEAMIARQTIAVLDRADAAAA